MANVLNICNQPNNYMYIKSYAVQINYLNSTFIHPIGNEINKTIYGLCLQVGNFPLMLWLGSANTFTTSKLKGEFRREK